MFEILQEYPVSVGSSFLSSGNGCSRILRGGELAESCMRTWCQSWYRQKGRSRVLAVIASWLKVVLRVTNSCSKVPFSLSPISLCPIYSDSHLFRVPFALIPVCFQFHLILVPSVFRFWFLFVKNNRCWTRHKSITIMTGLIFVTIIITWLAFNH